MPSTWWTIFIAASIVGISDVNSETTAYPDIPKHLLECYMNDGIYHKANRISSTYESFLDLLRIIEENPGSRNINARELSLVLLHYLKLDGIQSIQSQTKTSSNIVPFAPSGDEYFKHRLTLLGLVGRIDQSYLTAINESLTKKEMCNLHFMLSYSIDPYKRENERCSPIYEELRTQTYAEPRSDWNLYQKIPGRYYPYSNRKQRNAEKLIDEDGIDESEMMLKKKALKTLKRGYKSSRGSEEPESDLKESRHFLKRKRSADDKKAEVETIYFQQTETQNQNVHEKDKFTIGDQELLSASEDRPRGLQSLVQMQRGRYGGRPYTEEGSAYSGLLPGLTLSDCPSVNGIIATPFGSLAIGTVIAGIAAGLNPEDIPPVKLSVNPSEMESPMDKVNNIWATTLSGTVADTISSSAILEMDNLQILKGGWNESANAKWYLLKNNQFKHMTEVALRGSLDGLFLGANVKELMNKYSNFKLSELLQIYYEYFWGNLGAKNRVVMRPQYAPDETFRKQVHLMSLVLKRQKTNVITVLDLNLVTRETVDKVSNYIQNMDDRTLKLQSEPNSIDVVVNMVAVIDSTWGHETLLTIFELFREAKIAATPHQSNLTIFCGNDGRILMNAENSIELSSKFTEEMLFQNCTRGMNFPVVFESLELMYRKLYKDEETSNKMNTDAQVVVLFPFDTFFPENQEITVIKSLEFQKTFPDVRMMVAANGRPDAFKPLVRDTNNVYSIMPPTIDPTLKSIKDLSEGIKQSHQRISRPSCGSYFDDESQGTEVRITRDVFPNHIVYYKLLPQYFFTARGPITVSIQSKQRAPLTVCHSREVDKPEDSTSTRGYVPDYNSNYNPNTNYNPNSNYNPGYQTVRRVNDGEGPLQCKTITSEVYKIELFNPCYGAYTLDECSPLYISLRPPEQTISIICPNCRFPFNVQYEISADGLACYNTAAAILTNPISLLLSSLVFFLSNVKLF